MIILVAVFSKDADVLRFAFLNEKGALLKNNKNIVFSCGLRKRINKQSFLIKKMLLRN